MHRNRNKHKSHSSRKGVFDHGIKTAFIALGLGLVFVLLALFLGVPTVKAEVINLDKPFEPIFINMEAPHPYNDGNHELDIPLRKEYEPPASGEVKAYLEEGRRYHVFLIGDFVSNKTLSGQALTDYDIEVYGPGTNNPSRHTESAGQPEQVSLNDGNQQYFIPEKSSTYTFRIFNDPEDSQGEEPAIFMLIEHIETNRVYEVDLKGRQRVGSPYPSNYNYAYEFETPSEGFELIVEVPETLDMYEARVYPMANPSAGIGQTIRGVGVPIGNYLSGEAEGTYGGYNVSIEGNSHIEYTSSCEFKGEDMQVVFGKPKHNETEKASDDPTVFYYLVLLAEYDYGTAKFYIKTDYSKPIIGLKENPTGYTGSKTPLKVDVNSTYTIERVWVEYSTNQWSSNSSIDLQESSTGYSGLLPEFKKGERVDYRIYARDARTRDNLGFIEGSFQVKNQVNIELSLSQNSLKGGASLKAVGESNLAQTHHKLVFTSEEKTEEITVKTDESGRFEYNYKPPKSGSYKVVATYPGDQNNHNTSSNIENFEVMKRRLNVELNVENSPPKKDKPVKLSGNIQPPLPGIPVKIIIISPTDSTVETPVTEDNGSFSTTITPKETGRWQALPTIPESGYNERTQGSIVSFNVIPLTIPEKIKMKALALTRPPWLFALIGIAAGGIALAEFKTRFIQTTVNKLRNNDDNEPKEQKPEKEKETKEKTRYRRKSSR